MIIFKFLKLYITKNHFNDQQLIKIFSRNNIVNEQLIDLPDIHHMIKVVRDIYSVSAIVFFQKLHSYY